jgi:hypothetical protein
MASLWAVLLTREKPKGQVTSAFQSRARCPWYDHTITRCFLPDCPVPRCAIAGTRLSSLPQWRLFPTGNRFCSKLDTPMHSVPVFNTAGHPCSLYSIWKIWLELRLMSRKPHGGYWVPCICTADPCPGGTRSSPSAPPSPTHLRRTKGAAL